MSYRLVILNGERRGERWDLAAEPLTIGQGSTARLQFNEPTVGLPIHAEIIPRGRELFIRSPEASGRVLINGREVHAESRIQHGDVVQIGTTRLFIQSHDDSSTADNLTGFHRFRMWFTVGLPVLVVIITAVILQGVRSRPMPITPLPSAVPAESNRNNRYPDDCDVTNISRIRICDTMSLTAHPPDVVEAQQLMAALKSNVQDSGLSLSRTELDRATRFLENRTEQERGRQVSENQDWGVTDLTKAQAFLGAKIPVSQTPSGAMANAASFSVPDTNTPVAPLNAPALNHKEP